MTDYKFKIEAPSESEQESAASLLRRAYRAEVRIAARDVWEQVQDGLYTAEELIAEEVERSIIYTHDQYRILFCSDTLPSEVMHAGSSDVGKTMEWAAAAVYSYDIDKEYALLSGDWDAEAEGEKEQAAFQEALLDAEAAK